MTMKIHASKKAMMSALIFGIAFFMSACHHTPEPQAPMAHPCIPPTGVGLEQAMSRTRADLANMECQMRFDSYFQRLLDIGAGSPNTENRRLFSEFLVWASQNGLINRVQAEDRYNRYFNTTFMTLPDDYNTCSVCDKKDKLFFAMDSELRQKETGLLKICRDKESYYQAAAQFGDMKTVLEAACTACGAR